MAISKCASQRPYTERDSIKLTVEGEPVEQVSNFVYLSANISGDGTIDRDLDIRIQHANGAYHQLWKIWKSRTIRTPTKIRIYKATVITILLYGAEVRNTTKKQMKRFEVFHLTSLRRILKIKWFFHVSNEEVLRRAGIKTIETFIGWMACVLEDAADFKGVDNISRDAVKQLALKRVEWRNMLHRRRDVCDAGHSYD
ncbi:uncharacterized protein LOC134814892 [Bolinopsis microptera]|uniref:uncharacterized protein LOC134814892 n=1 Tax=Bolinopsis microptera TaxID=2820187 RepID=UPI00307A5DE4